MKKVAIIHSVTGLSAKSLKEALVNRGVKADIWRPFKDDSRDFTSYDLTINLGVSAPSLMAKKFLNTPQAVRSCVDKRKTFAILQEADLPIPEWTDSWDAIPKHWDQVVARQSASGRQGDHLEYYATKDVAPKDCELYTRAYYGRYEYRIYCLNGRVIGRFYKQPTGVDLYLQFRPREGFESIDKACIAASKAIGIDLCGFDVLSHNRNNFVLLEANSGPLIPDEIVQPLVSTIVRSL